MKRTGWVRNPIDAFISAKLAEKGLRPSCEADPRTLIRRLSRSRSQSRPIHSSPSRIDRVDSSVERLQVLADGVPVTCQDLVGLGPAGDAIESGSILLMNDARFDEPTLGVVSFEIDPSSRYNFWSGLTGGFFLALSYVLGMSVTYSALGVFAALSGRMFGAWLQSPAGSRKRSPAEPPRRRMRSGWTRTASWTS